MNIFDRTITSLFLAAMLASCNSSLATPTMSQEDSVGTHISSVSTVLAGTQRAIPTAIPTNTPMALPTISISTATPTAMALPMFALATITPTRHVQPTSVVPTTTPLAFTDPSIPLSERIVYYYFMEQRENPIPKGTVSVYHRLAPPYADETYTSGTAADLRTALELVLRDERNVWIGEILEAEIVDVTFRNGHAQVRLQGEYFFTSARCEPLCYALLEDALTQILLTVFANPAVQTAAVSLNEDTIANLGIFRNRDAKPANYVFRRIEIEMYLAENAARPIPPTPFGYTTPTPPAFIDPSLPLPELPADAIDLQWITAYELPGDQFFTKIHPTKDGGFILVGNMENLMHPHGLPVPPYGAVLLKLRADGFVVWQRFLPDVRVEGALETSAGDLVLAGLDRLIKLDAQGNLLWTYMLEQSEEQSASYYGGLLLRLVEESNGNIVVEAKGSRTVFNADGELQSITGYAVPWGSLAYPENVRDRSGETLWAGGGEEFYYWVGKADRNNGWLNVFSFPENPTGRMLFIQTTVDGGALMGVPVYVEGGTFDLIISRFSGDGSVRWQKVYGAYLDAFYGFHAFETRSGDFIVAGTLRYYRNANDANEGIGAGGIWMLRLDREGNIRWMKLYGGGSRVDDIHELSNGDLIFAGTRGGDSGDMWVLKTNAQGEIPNCGLALDIPESWGRTRGVSPEVETRALEGVSVSEQETLPIFFRGERGLYDTDAPQVIPLCSPSP
jgi:hypothetical protein